MKQEDLRETINGEHIPNSAGITESDAHTGTGHGYQFYPEDIKKMFTLSDEDMIAYRDKLIRENKFIKRW